MLAWKTINTNRHTHAPHKQLYKQTEGNRHIIIIVRDAQKRAENTLLILIEPKISVCHFIRHWSPLSSSSQEAFPESVSITLLVTTTLKISGMDKVCDAISCNISLQGWAGAWCWYIWKDGEGGFTGWWVRVKQPGHSVSSPKVSQAWP